MSDLTLELFTSVLTTPLRHEFTSTEYDNLEAKAGCRLVSEIHVLETAKGVEAYQAYTPGLMRWTAFRTILHY